MKRLYKTTEWTNAPNNWQVGDCSDLSNNSNAWWIPARFLNLSFEDWILKLKNEFNATIDKFCPEANNGKSLLLYHWTNYNDAHKFSLWINKIARNNNWTI